MPAETLVIDWGTIGALHVFCAVLAWSRVRFVRFARDETAATTLGLLAECFEQLGGVPAKVLADRMGARAFRRASRRVNCAAFRAIRWVVRGGAWRTPGTELVGRSAR